MKEYGTVWGRTVRTTRGPTALCLSVVLVLAIAGLVRGYVIGAIGTGTTEITSTTCAADVYGTIPAVLDVTNGDDVNLYYNVSWDDTRSASSPQANHYFNMTATYSGTGVTQYAWHTKDTFGSESGSQDLFIQLTSVQEHETIDLSWLAKLTSQDCSPNTVSDFVSGTILLT